MKLIAVCVVENEADVIEAFVRHTCTLVDAVLVADCGSVDGTREIVAALAKEGLPVRLFEGCADGAGEKLRDVAVGECGADRVLTLRADEFVVVENRAALERALKVGAVRASARDYVATIEDDGRELNPVVRIVWRKRAVGQIGLGWSAGDRGGGDEEALPVAAGVEVARFGLRSPLRAGLEVIKGELTKLAAGRAREGLDTHFRLGFQLLMEEPRRFAETILPKRERLEQAPVGYRGGPLRYSEFADERSRGLRVLLPLLERQARELGQRRDGEKPGEAGEERGWREIDAGEVAWPGGGRFEGFEAGSGWERLEGPYAPGFLPEFRWTRAPEAVAVVRVENARTAWIDAEMLTYAERQVTTMLLNGVELARVEFPRVNEKHVVRVRGELVAGENRLVFRHRTWIESASDPRKLAVIFLGLRVE